MRRRNDLRSLRVLITGAASGFGEGTAGALRARGAAVAGIDLHAGSGIAVADVRDQAQVDEAVGIAVERLGGLDVLVNNAGVGEPQDAAAPPDVRAVAVFETNFLGAWRVTAAAMPALLHGRGRVINIASGLAHVPMPFAAAYAASKRALVAYSDVLRLEYGDVIAVTTVYPGYVRTPIHGPSERMGLSLAGVVPEESIDTVVRTVVRACVGRPRREVATSITTGAGVFLARHFPRATDRAVALRMRALVRGGRFQDSDLITRLVR